MMDIDPKLLPLLRCPLLHCPLVREGDELVATKPPGMGLRYPIRKGIPVMLIDEAKLPSGVASLDEFRRKFADMIPS
ncbi:MAG: Trm112 family protein [Phycisphaerales bacterium]|nr:Trm112 family protein [Phycisphaerales bacterium]